MNKTVFGLVLAASLAANAQSTSATAPAAAAQTTTATATATAPAATSKWSGIIAADVFTGVDSQKEKGAQATVASDYVVGLGYKLTPKVKVQVDQLFHTASNRVELTPAQNALFARGRNQVAGDLVLRTSYSSEMTILNSKPLAFGARFYMPTSQQAQDAQRHGIARLDVSPTWELNPTYSLSFDLSQRITLPKSDRATKYTDGVANTGPDALYRLNWGPTLTANINDSLSTYYGMTTYNVSSKLNRGDVTFDGANFLIHEVGVNYTLGPIGVTPSIASWVDLNDGSSSLVTDESRLFAHETMYYQLGLSATF